VPEALYPRLSQAATILPLVRGHFAEAAARRAERDRHADQAKESGGRGGLDPTRYGDWEKDGLISDF